MNQELFDKLMDQIDQEFEELGVMDIKNMSSKHGRPARYKRLIELVALECAAICNRRAEVLQIHLDERGKNMAEEPRFFTEGAISGSLRNAQSIRQQFGIDS